jgi:hypothetical protein
MGPAILVMTIQFVANTHMVADAGYINCQNFCSICGNHIPSFLRKQKSILKSWAPAFAGTTKVLFNGHFFGICYMQS